MSDETAASGRLDWVHWPTMAKSLALGVGVGLVLAVTLGDFYLGLALGTINGVAFGIGWSRSRGG
ncbi:hypothetical protein [Haloarcula salina]|uniref:Uncharacterized protein n=1 Tax=Haloarcula salina TaxID=1429914 RepID=A0AA41G015_9EURY|nr:hypothetical protein [Haloarcula salina]MBV0901910.1 hypothetical protein [Haloarcula salina]